MEIFSALLAIYAGNSPVTGEFPSHKGQWRVALMFSLICAWINGFVNIREAGDMRRYRAHYDVIEMGVYSCVDKNEFNKFTKLRPVKIELGFYPSPVRAFGYCRCLCLRVHPSMC